jgi:hypothetical protein
LKRRDWLRLLVPGALAGALPAAAADEVVRRFGRASVRADVSRARPGGVVVVRLSGVRRGAASAILDGRRAPFHGGRALVPVPADTEPGSHRLGVEVRARSGVQRVALSVTIAAASPAGAARLLSPEVAARIADESSVRDGRRLLAAVRESGAKAAQAPPLQAPVAAPVALGFGAALAYVDQPAIGPRFDGHYGEVHRGLDYDVAPGTVVRAPGAGVVTLAGELSLPGLTAVIDHGQGLVSMLCHLSRLDAQAGETLAAGAVVGLSGESGIAGTPHLHWGVYLHGVAVDPLVVLTAL